MRTWLRGKPGGAVAFLAIAALLAGGLGWATRSALALERERLAQRAEAEQAERLRVALWRLDGRVASWLAREDGRPVSHYSAVFAPPLALTAAGAPWEPGAVLEPSPLLHDPLPAWVRLYFQAGDGPRWESPQVLSDTLTARLRDKGGVPLTNVTPRRRALLAKLSRAVPGKELLAQARAHAGQRSLDERNVWLARRNEEMARSGDPVAQDVQNFREYYNRFQNLSWLAAQERVPPQMLANTVFLRNTADNGERWLTAPPGRAGRGPEVAVHKSPMVGVWLPVPGGDEELVVLRLVSAEGKEFTQGVLLDGEKLRGLLEEDARGLLAGARVLPVRGPVPERPDRSMTTLPFELDPGPAPDPAGPGWTPLRVGLALAWSALGVALAAVALGGWSLIDLSQRRARFVSAVTHELRTPLTTLRLYLDMLLGGMVRDESQRQEYLRTLRAEADRLHRLIANVLDFARLEGRRPDVNRARRPVAELLAQVAEAWRVRCADAGKELVVEDRLGPGAGVWTDGDLLGQVLGNLIDNACKYTAEAPDRRVWLRALAEGGKLVLEVEDRGPGVPPAERGAIFRAFRRGRGSDASTGGVGLGLALARRWVGLLGGRLVLGPAPAEGGACFRVELPGGEGG